MQNFPTALRQSVALVHRLWNRHYSPALALAIAVGIGLIAASLLSLVIESLFQIHWWTALTYMAVFFATAVQLYRRFSPEGTRMAIDGSRRYLEDSGTLDLVDAARELTRSR